MLQGNLQGWAGSQIPCGVPLYSLLSKTQGTQKAQSTQTLVRFTIYRILSIVLHQQKEQCTTRQAFSA